MKTLFVDRLPPCDRSVQKNARMSPDIVKPITDAGPVRYIFILDATDTIVDVFRPVVRIPEL
jgi:hypothetical protein